MVNKSVTGIMKSHRFVRQVEQNELSEFDTAPMLQAISQLDLGPAHIDIGKLVVKYQSNKQLLSATIVTDKNVVIYCWYDNEFSYSCEVVRCIEKFAGVDWQRYPIEIE